MLVGLRCCGSMALCVVAVRCLRWALSLLRSIGGCCYVRCSLWLAEVRCRRLLLRVGIVVTLCCWWLFVVIVVWCC